MKKLSAQELACVLWGLRELQRQIDSYAGAVGMVDHSDLFFNDVEPPTSEGIDELCDRLNA